MRAGMAEVIAAHKELAWEVETGLSYCECGVKLCSMSAPIEAQHQKLYAHAAKELAKAGYGELGEARAVAWDCGFEDGWSEARNPGAFVNDVWDAKTPNPYREPQHG